MNQSQTYRVYSHKGRVASHQNPAKVSTLVVGLNGGRQIMSMKKGGQEYAKFLAGKPLSRKEAILAQCYVKQSASLIRIMY